MVGDNGYLIFGIGFLAQIFFSGRILCQWILSERAKEVVSPTIFWVLSIAGSYLLCIYGWMRNDFAIILGQFISYYIYMWNLNEKGIWDKIHWLFKTLLIITPIVAAGFALNDLPNFVDNFFRSQHLPLWLLVFGSIGQIVFTLRFIYQWYYSYKRNESILPSGFWMISLIGSFIIIAYGVIRLDPVLILGRSVGFVAYTRNLIIGYRHAKTLKNEE